MRPLPHTITALTQFCSDARSATLPPSAAASRAWEKEKEPTGNAVESHANSRQIPEGSAGSFMDMIGADFWIERRLQIDNLASELRHHFGNHMVGANAQSLAGDLHGQMPIAEMPGNTQKVRGTGGRGFEQRVRGGGGPQGSAAPPFDTRTLR